MRSGEEIEAMIASRALRQSSRRGAVASLRHDVRPAARSGGTGACRRAGDYDVVPADERDIYLVAHRQPDGRHGPGLDKFDRQLDKGAHRHHAQLEHHPQGAHVITVLGSANLDLIGTVSRIPSPGETVPGGAFSTAAGGKGANQALAARRAGAEVRMFAAVGNDGFADEALGVLRADGVDLSRVPKTCEGSRPASP